MKDVEVAKAVRLLKKTVSDVENSIIGAESVRKKESIYAWCGGTRHIERTCYDKINGAARGVKAGS